jgi:release factor glutamine methyltransferase
MTRPATARVALVEPPPEGTPWTVLHLIRWSTAYLSGKGIGAARLDVEHLLAHVMGVDRLDLYLRFEQPVAREELDRFRPLLRERARRKPLQYILGRSAFRDLDLAVDPRALIPRPETEELVGAVLDHVAARGRSGLRALDLGTGSGAIALALAREGPFERIVATDASPAALEVARANVSALSPEGKVECRGGNLFEAVAPGERFDVLVSNPPYVAELEFPELQAEVRLWEPKEALVAGEDGLLVIRRIVRGAGDVLERGGLLALEVGAGQARNVAEFVRSTRGFDAPGVLRDLAGVERIVLGVWRDN